MEVRTGWFILCAYTQPQNMTHFLFGRWIHVVIIIDNKTGKMYDLIELTSVIALHSMSEK